MPTLLILILALLIATCVIAYWSDNLGKKLGKKRISLFGLRPRQTATFISMGSSVGIMLLTLGVLLASNASLRNALTRYDQTKKENRLLQETNADLKVAGTRLAKATSDAEARARSAQDKATAAEKQAEDARTKSEQARTQLTKIQGELTTARQEAQAAQGRAATAQNQFRMAQAGLRTAQGDLRTAQNRLTLAQRTLKANEASLKKANLQLKSVNYQLKEVKVEITRNEATLSATRRSLNSTKRALDSTRDFFRSARRNFEEQIADLEGQQRRLVAERDRLEQERNRLEGERVELETQVENARVILANTNQVASAISTGDIGIAFLDVFADHTLAPNTNREATIAAVRSLLARGEAALKKRDEQHEMVLVRKLPVGTITAELSEEQLFNTLATYVASSRVPVSVRLVASRDHATGEKSILVRLITIPIETIFPKDEVITEAAIASRSTDAQVFGQLWGLLTEAQMIAHSRGSRPILSPENPFRYAPGTNERIFDTLRRIQSSGQAVEVRVIAAEEINTIDRLNVRFDVREPNP